MSNPQFIYIPSGTRISILEFYADHPWRGDRFSLGKIMTGEMKGRLFIRWESDRGVPNSGGTDTLLPEEVSSREFVTVDYLISLVKASKSRNLYNPEHRICLTGDELTWMDTVKYSPCQGQMNLNSWRSPQKHVKIELSAIGG